MSFDELPFDIHLKILKLACTPLVEHCYLEFINEEVILDFDGKVLTDTIHDTDDEFHYIHRWLDPYIAKMKKKD